MHCPTFVFALGALSLCAACSGSSPSSDAGGSSSPDASLDAECALTIHPGDSFVDAFAMIGEGEWLCLDDGTYHQAMNVPSHKNVRAVHVGGADIDGGGELGVEWSGGLFQMLGDGSSAYGLKVHHAGPLSNACQIGGTNHTMRFMSCSHGGTHKHKIPLLISGSGHLVEDSWFYGEGRYVVQCFLGADSTVRRNIVRWDSTIAGEPDEPNAGLSNYACADMIWENNISLDYGIPETRMSHCGDFCLSTTPAMDGMPGVSNVNVRILGLIVFNHATDTDNDIALRPDSKSSSPPSTGVSVEDLFVRRVGLGAAVHPTLYPDFHLGRCTLVDVSGGAGRMGTTTFSCAGDADVSHRYVDGVLTSDDLFPFPAEAFAKADMCAPGERDSEWCSFGGTLREYVLGM